MASKTLQATAYVWRSDYGRKIWKPFHKNPWQTTVRLQDSGDTTSLWTWCLVRRCKISITIDLVCHCGARGAYLFWIDPHHFVSVLQPQISLPAVYITLLTFTVQLSLLPRVCSHSILLLKSFECRKGCCSGIFVTVATQSAARQSPVVGIKTVAAIQTSMTIVIPNGYNRSLCY